MGKWILLLIALLCTAGSAKAGDPKFWGNYPPDVHAWFPTVMQPGWEDAVGQGRSCCGVSDAFEARVINQDPISGNISIVIDDGKGAVPDGTVVYAPRDKIQVHFGNPVGKLIVFINAGNLFVYCLVPFAGN